MMIIIIVVGCLTLSRLSLSQSDESSPMEHRYNALFSAQCKARCLYEYRSDSQQQSQPQQHQQRSLSSIYPDGKSNRILANSPSTLSWRSIWTRCPRLETCSSCLLPCDLDPPLLLSNEQTCSAICSTSKTNECQRSCVFIRHLYRQGSVCSSSSTVNDCSEKVPMISNVTAMERKSRRTVRLKWFSNPMKIDEPIFYVIEAQWILSGKNSHHHHQDLISKWGFLKEEVSQSKAIIRNIQRDQRSYFFRIAAVTRHGSSSFISTTKPFRLSNQSRRNPSLIEAPRNFTVKDLKIHSNQMNLTLMWRPPDEFIDGFQISWQIENSSNEHFFDVSTLETTIPFLSTSKSYLFKIRSMIVTDGDEKQLSLPELIHFHSAEEFSSIRQFEMSSPFFHNGFIRSNLSWNNLLDQHVKQYDLSWIETQCYSDVSSCCYRRDAVTTQNSFQLTDLRYNCSYLLTIEPIGSTRSFNRTFQISFNVSSCQLTDVQGSIPPPCHLDRQSIDLFTSLPPVDLLVIRNQSGMIFNWRSISSTDLLLRYRLDVEKIFSQEFSSSVTSVYLPYSSQHEWNQQLNVTLSLIHDETIRQQQTILIDAEKHEDFVFISSSSSSFVSFSTFPLISIFFFLQSTGSFIIL